ncbi:MAG: LON peptidase substrate-binding domain-containing protein [Planctomycetota bacterium]|nr:LON peptidase substrate-binding domain-containing protein [Planctomycetota bacterium]
MEAATTIDFSEPIALFPMPGVMVLPHASIPLHIFEPQSVRMIDDCLEGCAENDPLSGKAVALASLRIGVRPEVALRSTVCVTKIVRRQTLSDQRQMIVVAGVCRARILAMVEEDEDHPYRRAMLIPMESPSTTEDLRPVLRNLCEMLENPRLGQMQDARTVVRMLRDKQIPPVVALDIASLILVRDDDDRYRLLEATDPRARVRLLWRTVWGMDRLINRAQSQGSTAWPKGMSWN